MSAIRYAHKTVGGNPDDAVRYGLTVIAKCGLVFVPKSVGREVDAYPECVPCHSNVPNRDDGRPHFVYRCFDRLGRLVYVGCSVAPRTRLEQHRLSSWWFEQVGRTTFTVFPNREYALYRERTAIESENPRWNIRHRDQTNWTLEDYRDHHCALTFNGANEKRLEKVRSLAQFHFGVDITDPIENAS